MDLLSTVSNAATILTAVVPTAHGGIFLSPAKAADRKTANVPQELRDRFELFGEDVLANGIANADIDPIWQGVELAGLLQMRRADNGCKTGAT
jgi:hypothetical protein